MMVRSGRVVANRTHRLSEVAAWSPEQIMAQGLMQLYDQGLDPPSLILVSHMPEDPSLVAEVLAEKSGRKVELHKPQRGENRALMDMALANAAAPRADRDQARQDALAHLGRRLGLAEPPGRMECVDISHLGGSLTVASLVSFRGGQPDKAGYRHYNVLGQEEHPDDYASMAQVLTRRLAKGDPPDLLVVDGGKGQLNIALAVLDDLNLDPADSPALAALAKGREEGPDKVYLPGRKNPVNFPAGDAGLLMLMRLRDEAHRFAITYHRRLRRKALTRSILEEVPGVGPVRRKKLLTVFKSLAAIRQASVEELSARGGLDKASAQRLAAFLGALDSTNGRL
jgi:excinuclease ABC subunit C